VLKIGVLSVVVSFAVFDVGEETFLNAMEGAEVLVEVGNGFTAAEGLEDAVLDEAEDGFEVGFAMGLLVDLESGGVVADGLDGDGVAVVAGEEFAEGAFAGGHGEATFFAGFGELLDDGVVGEFGGKVEDEGLVGLREAGEHVEAFHIVSGKWLVVSDKFSAAVGCGCLTGGSMGCGRGQMARSASAPYHWH